MNLFHLWDCKHPVEPCVNLGEFRLKSCKLSDCVGLCKFASSTYISYGWLLSSQIGGILQPVGLHQGEGSLEDHIALLYGFLRSSFPSEGRDILAE